MSDVFYVGSYDQLRAGEVKTTPVDFAKMDQRFLDALERYRPPSMLPYKDAVHLVADPDDVDNAGHATHWISAVHAMAPVSRHDMCWTTKLALELADGASLSGTTVAALANGYWSGREHPTDESVWEVLTDKALVIRSEPFEGFEPAESDKLPAHVAAAFAAPQQPARKRNRP